MEHTISIGQLRQNPTDMVRDVRHGATYTLTDRGQPVADISPHRPALAHGAGGRRGAFGVRATADTVQQAIREARLVRLTRELGPGLPFDDDSAAASGLLAGLVRAAGRRPRARAVDLMIAATAHANGAAVLTRNPNDFAGLEPLVPIMAP